MTAAPDPSDRPGIAARLAAEGLRRPSAEALLGALGAELSARGAPVLHMHVTHSALHPVYGGLGYHWRRPAPEAVRQTYSHRDTPDRAWTESPFHHMLARRLARYREALGPAAPRSRFPALEERRADGATDYLAAGLLFSGVDMPADLDPDDPPEGMFVSWTTDAPGGFDAAALALLDAAVEPLALALRSLADRETARRLLEVYLGADAGRRVLSGEIRRGDVRTLDAVILAFDLAGFTALTETLAGDAVVALLNARLGPAVEAVDAEGGTVLKFLGDGLLAIFDRGARPDAADAAIAAALGIEAAMARLDAGGARLGYGVALHAGPVMYGNVGAPARLDFTVIGPAVNAAARIQDLTRRLGRRVVVSAEVARDAGRFRGRLLPLGPYGLRGVSGETELFALRPG